MIPNSEFERLKEAVSIEDVVNLFVRLKPSGTTYKKGLCPFHKEKTASFYITPNKGIYKCYGCGVGGDIFTFVRDHENLPSNSAALRWIAAKFSIPIREIETGSDGPITQDSSAIAACNEQMQLYYRERLLESKEVKTYLWKQRGIDSMEDIDKFDLGYCPNTWKEDSAPLQLVFNTATNYQMQSWGITNKANKPFMGGRITFAIRNTAGQIVAFGGRNHNAYSEAKYLNTPETILYDKSRELYGLWQCQKQMKAEKEAMIVEGYFDVISTQKKGECSVSPCGTSFSAAHAKAIAKKIVDAYIAFDPDKAGIKATMRAIPAFWKYGIDPLPLIPETKQDPDEIYKGCDDINEARTHYVAEDSIRVICKGLNLTTKEMVTTDYKAKTILKMISTSPLPLFREKLIRSLAAQLGINAKTLIDEYNRHARKEWYSYK